MRCVSVVDRVELDASVGSVMPAAICVGDVDNDGTNELCVGTIDGLVYVYKGVTNSKPWCQWSCATANEGSSEVISCLTIGEVFNKGKNSLIVSTTAGWLHIFDVHSDVHWTRPSKSRSNSFSTAIRPGRSASNTMVGSGAVVGSTKNDSQKDSSLRDISCDSASATPQSTSFDMKPIFSQRFSYHFNSKIIVAAKVCLTDEHSQKASSSSKTRLIVAYTDRIVRLFTWQDAVYSTSATVYAPGGLSSPFEEVHFNLVNNVSNNDGGGGAGGGGGGDTGSNTTSMQGSGSGDRESGASRHSSFSTHSSADVGSGVGGGVGVGAGPGLPTSCGGLQGSFKVDFIWTLSGQVDSVSVLPCVGAGCGGGEGDGGGGDEDDGGATVAEASAAEGAVVRGGDGCCCSQIFASQPGGKFVSLTVKEESSTMVQVETEEGVQRRDGNDTKTTKEGETGKEGEETEETTSTTTTTTSSSDTARDKSTHETRHPRHGIVQLRNTKTERLRSDGVTTHVLSIQRTSSSTSSSPSCCPTYTAVATMDGNISLFNSKTVSKTSRDEEPETIVSDHLAWTKQLDHEFAFIRPLHPPPLSSSIVDRSESDFDDDPMFVVCAWDGQTFVINKEGDILKFFIEDSIAAFDVGSLTFECPGSSSGFPQSPSAVRSGSNSHLDNESYSNSPKATHSPRHNSASTFSSPRPSNSSATLIGGGGVCASAAQSVASPTSSSSEKLCFVYVTTNGKIFAIPAIDDFFQDEKSTMSSSLKSAGLLDALDKTAEGDEILHLIDKMGLATENAYDPKLRDFIYCTLYS